MKGLATFYYEGKGCIGRPVGQGVEHCDEHDRQQEQRRLEERPEPPSTEEASGESLELPGAARQSRAEEPGVELPLEEAQQAEEAEQVD